MYLCLSLGHNSSAVMFFESDKDPIGYEEERLSKKKSDSAFPILSITRILEVLGPDAAAQVKDIYISHWFDNFEPEFAENKYYSAQQLKTLFPNASFKTTNSIYTHHDAHAQSVAAFFSHHDDLSKQYTLLPDERPELILVVDGFGNNGEIASLYELDRYGFPSKRETIFGYEHSMGLLYQYAAEAVGMDGMNDVYKFLGYRTHIKYQDIARCDALATEITSKYLVAWMNPSLCRTAPAIRHADLIDYAKLKQVKEDCMRLFTPVIDDDQFMSRVRVGYVVQKVLEDVIIRYLSVFKFKTLLVSGGVFYNVRLNDKLRKTFPDVKFCAMPLAGDQGAAIGLAFAHGKCIDHEFKNLFWGVRPTDESCTLEKVVINDQGIERIADLIASGVIVNVFHGAMEFGPRALCNTSTLALCSRELVDAINVANGRTTVMPMAPAIRKEIMPYLFSNADLERTVASDKFMITAHNFLPRVSVNEFGGAMHRDVDGTYSGRPQIITEDTDFMYRLLGVLFNKHHRRAIINTSLNLHGQPIVYSQQDLMAVHTKWTETCPAQFETFILEQPK